MQELYYIHIYLFCSVEHCTYRNIVRDSKYPQNVSEILNCSHSLANNVLHSSSIYKLASAIYLALYIPQYSRKYILYTIIMAAIYRDHSTLRYCSIRTIQTPPPLSDLLP